MNYIKLIVSGVVGGILALIGGVFVLHPTTQTVPGSLGAAANVTTIGNPWVFTSSITAAALTMSGTLTQSTTNTATTSAKVGCIQTTATSTATPVRFTLSPFTGTTTTQGAVSNFLVAAQYGTCPS